ncbi:MAG: metal-sensitive transcriptional regulator [Gemmatimonadaceae bacterium]|nr:metal-sensitive transcriptional regulator [Gemmatimonadaceae bacterium]
MAPGAGAGGGAGEEASGGTGGERGAESTAACGCGCGVTPGGAVGGGRKAVGVDPAIKERNLKRLRRIEGQVRGLQRMVEEDRYCPEILTQISSVHEALRSTGRELMRNHLRHCVTAAVASGPEGAEAAYDELIELMYRHAR